MFSKLMLATIMVLLLASCAQVGSISGGPIDETPPKIKSMSPENKSLNFKEKEIKIEFKDFIKLNNPTQTISVIPPDFKVKTTLKGKTLLLNWDEPLKENTTYSIFLNQTVQDITEGNDSIMQIVFSTGNQLDSLTYTTFVQDALSKEASKKITVGLFEAEDSLKPMYFAQTDDNGRASFSYLKQGNYFVRAFDDANKDLKISKAEQVGFVNNGIQLDSSIVDSIPFQLFTPLLPPRITTSTFQSPGAFILAANRSLMDASLSINGNPLLQTSIEVIEKDSLRLFYVPTESTPVEIVVSSSVFNDTIKVRILENAKSKPLTIQAPEGAQLTPSSPLQFKVLDGIKEVDTSKILIQQFPDSAIIRNYTFSFEKNALTLNIPRNNVEKFKIEFEEGAITGNSNSKNTATTSTLKNVQEKELGILNVNLSGYTTAIILEVFLAGKKTKDYPISSPAILKLIDLTPGDYTFRVIVDENENGMWDTGDFDLKKQPEQIHTFSEPTKVRANWEIELELLPTN